MAKDTFRKRCRKKAAKRKSRFTKANHGKMPKKGH